MKVEMRVKIEIMIKDQEGYAGIHLPQTRFSYGITDNITINSLGAQHRPGSNKVCYQLAHGPTRIQGRFDYKGFHFFLFQSHLAQLLNYHHHQGDLSKLEYQLIMDLIDLKPWMGIQLNIEGADEKMIKKATRKKPDIRDCYSQDIERLTNRINELTALEKVGHLFCRTCGASLESQILETYESLDATQKGLERYKSQEAKI
jgi:hypothetical protein